MTEPQDPGEYDAANPSQPAPPPGSSTWQHRRLIILVVDQGEDPVVEWEGSFAYYELKAAMERAMQLIEEAEFIQTMEDEVPPDERPS